MTTQTHDLTATRPHTRRTLFQRLGRFILRLMGWRLVDRRPPTRKYLVIGAFHTSNMDFFIALPAMMALGLRPRWIGKKELFRGPLGPLMRFLGGIPVDRSVRTGFVGQMVHNFQTHEDFVVLIAPEGTRKFTDHWKSGFYHIAVQAGVPIALGFLDYPTRTVGIGDAFLPSGDPEADLERIRAFYADKRGRYPENHSTIRLKGKKSTPTEDTPSTRG